MNLARAVSGFAAAGERAPWEQDELDSWRRPRQWPGQRHTVHKAEPVRYIGPFKYRFWQWPLILAATAAAAANYLEITVIYPFYAVGGCELLARVLFCDLIAYSQRNLRDVPLLWWLTAYFFPPVTMAYLYFFPADGGTRRVQRLKRDAIFAAACVLYGAFRLLT